MFGIEIMNNNVVASASRPKVAMEIISVYRFYLVATILLIPSAFLYLGIFEKNYLFSIFESTSLLDFLYLVFSSSVLPFVFVMTLVTGLCAFHFWRELKLGRKTVSIPIDHATVIH